MICRFGLGGIGEGCGLWIEAMGFRLLSLFPERTVLDGP